MNQFTAQENRVSAEDARCELSASLVKQQSAESELRENEHTLFLIKLELQQEKTDSRILKENNARQASLIKSLREHLILSDNKRWEISSNLNQYYSGPEKIGKCLES